MNAGWNFADVWERVARRFGPRTALIHGDQQVSWAEFDRSADAVAGWLVARGLEEGDSVALYMRNSPAYLTALYAAFKVGLSPVNTNFRYGPGELESLWNDADVMAVVFDAEFSATCADVRADEASGRHWLQVGGQPHTWAASYEETIQVPCERVVPAWGRSGDQLFLLYTGGTTGKPKGVMWRQDDLFVMLEEVSGRSVAERADPDHYVAEIQRPGPTVLPAAPLMHGTAVWFALPALSRGGTVVTLTSPRLDAAELLDTVCKRRVTGVSIVGDAFARPIVQALEREPSRWDLSHLRIIASSGAMLSTPVKRALVSASPRVTIVDSLGSSESGLLARSITTHEGGATTSRFRSKPGTRVLDDHGKDVQPGSGTVGRLAVHGRLPLGYYKDEAKSRSTFLVVDGHRYAVAGDLATVLEDGTVELLGRGSGCINTGGEKVFPEEVEESLKTAPQVLDAAVVGLPDERFGEVVAAIVELDGTAELDEQALIEHVRARLARYKAPRRIFHVDSLERAANGKLDYSALRLIAAEFAREQNRQP